MRPFDDADLTAVTALRMLAIDQVEQARSGHPGLPLGAAPMAYALWSRILRIEPEDPAWPDRDRFVLSAGHGSALLYALLHLFGFDLPLSELKRFRQWGSLTPGHPEHGLTPGVEITTGPLGQGLAAAVGMALAERHLAGRFNRDGFPIVDHRTWVLASDGDLMEGISHEAASLAGHLRLGRLAVLYDDNHITIEGSTSLAFSEDVATRFTGYGWRVLHVENGNDLQAITAALKEAASAEEAPTLIRVRTHIGFGSPKQDDAEAHGAPLGAVAAAATRKALGWPIDEPFVVPEEIRAHFRSQVARGRQKHGSWLELLTRYRTAFPALAGEFERRWRGELPDGWDRDLPRFSAEKPLATREASGKALNAIAPRVPELIGGSADLAPSNNTLLAGETDVAAGAYSGRNLHFGVREHAMAAVANGMALHSGLRPFAATFLIFSDYLRPALRLAALQKLPVIFVFTHDSIALGEDGPTHQPIEHFVALRVIPNLVVLRPADANETTEAWRVAMTRRDGPTALLLTRQKLPVLTPAAPGSVERGAYIRSEAPNGAPEVVLIATGSEVSLALAARDRLETSGIPTRVVSAPSLELLARQDVAYQRAVLGPRHALRVAIEMGRGQGWHRWVGDGEIISLNRFGASAPAADVIRGLGYTVEAVVQRVEDARSARRAAPVTVEMPAGLRQQAEELRAHLRACEAGGRLLARDAGLWGEAHAGAVSRRLGWLDLPARMRAELPSLERLTAALAADGVDTIYLLGMGGSSLAPQVIRDLGGKPAGRDLVVVDTTDPDRLNRILDRLEPKRSAVLAVSKSGTTAETAALLEVFWGRFKTALPDPGRRFVALTEPGSALARLAARRSFRAVVPHPVDVGGRFSALSAVGLFPALWLGLSADGILDAGERALADIRDGHPAVELALAVASAARNGWGRMVWASSPALAPLGTWVEQLVAESTGKGGRGILPVILDGAARLDPSWRDTAVVSPRFTDEDVTALDAALDAASGHGPLVRWRLRRDGLGEAFVVWELATALTAMLLGVNPFDEPDVVGAKDSARALLARSFSSPPIPTPDPAAALASHLLGIGPDEAVALLAFLPERDDVSEALHALGWAISVRLGAPVTTAFGPRYLHSSGQLHKGGPARLIPVVLTGDPDRDVTVPGASYTLGQLRRAQAMGDVAALREAGKNVLHVHVGNAAVAALAAMRKTFSG